MAKVTSTKSVEFPKLNWGINAGATRELPEDPKAQEQILAHSAISIVEGEKPDTKPKEEVKQGEAKK